MSSQEYVQSSQARNKLIQAWIRQKVKSRLLGLIEAVSGKVQERQGSFESENPNKVNPFDEISKSYKEQSSIYSALREKQEMSPADQISEESVTQNDSRVS